MGFFEMLWAYIIVFLLAAIPFIEAVVIIPIAILGGLSAVPVFIVALLGNYLTVLLIILFIDRIKQWRNKKRQADAEDKTEKRQKRAYKIWQKYGLPGLALIGPFFVGSHVTAFMSLIFGGTKQKVALWMAISLVAWGILFAVLGHLGVDYFNIDNPFLERIFLSQ